LITAFNIQLIQCLFSLYFVLCDVFTRTRRALDFKHASQEHGIHKYMKEDEDTYMAIVESIRLMALIHLLWWNTSVWG